MSGTRDDWEKPRSRGNHLTDDEILFIRKSYRDGKLIRDVARELKCSSRVVQKYYSIFAGRAVHRPHQTKKALPPEAPKALPDRFYRSSFEPS